MSYIKKQEGSYENNQSQQLLQLHCTLHYFSVVMLDFLWHNLPTATLTNTFSSCNLYHRSYSLFLAGFTTHVMHVKLTILKANNTSISFMFVRTGNWKNIIVEDKDTLHAEGSINFQ